MNELIDYIYKNSSNEQKIHYNLYFIRKEILIYSCAIMSFIGNCFALFSLFLASFDLIFIIPTILFAIMAFILFLMSAYGETKAKEVFIEYINNKNGLKPLKGGLNGRKHLKNTRNT